MGKRLYRPDYGFGVGLGAGFGFFAGLETPKLMSKIPNPLRNESSRFMIAFLSWSVSKAFSGFLESDFVLTHPGHKSKNVARVGHPDFLPSLVVLYLRFDRGS